jgi:hypothetical protein
VLQRVRDFENTLQRQRVIAIEQRPCFSRFGEPALGLFERLGKPQGETFPERASTTIRNGPLNLVPLEIG